METKYTPGPWVWEKNPRTAHTFNVLGDGIRLAEIVSGPAEFTEPKYGCPEFIGTQGEANARLIAAAPELLEVLLALRDHLEVKNPATQNNATEHALEGNAIRNRMYAAIAKATGAA